MSTTAPASLSIASIADNSQQFLPLFPTQTEAVILARMQDWANEGLDPIANADIWVDTREGSHFQTVLMPAIREFARLYDLAGSEVPMSGFVLWAWETYLDDLAAVYEVFRLPGTPSLGTVSFSGPAGTVIDPGVNVSALQLSPSYAAPLFEVTVGGTIPDDGTGNGELDLAVQATAVGIAGDVAADAITVPSSPLPGVTFTNAEETLGGTDVETDDALRTRVLAAIASSGPGAVLDYIRWAGGWPGVGKVSVVPVWNGAGTVLVMISDPNGQPLPQAIVNGLQQNLDPVSGQGSGVAPVGAIVTVDTSTLLPAPVIADITYENGYSWDGYGGTIAVGPGVQAQIIAYYLSVAPGSEVVLAHVSGLIATFPGVFDVGGVTIAGAAANLQVGLEPPQVPVLSSFTDTSGQ